MFTATPIVVNYSSWDEIKKLEVNISLTNPLPTSWTNIAIDASLETMVFGKPLKDCLVDVVNYINTNILNDEFQFTLQNLSITDLFNIDKEVALLETL